MGDGWFSDGSDFAFDYYNSYVIQPMIFEIIQEFKIHKTPISNVSKPEIVKIRMQRYGEIYERLISPEGTFPVFGRSMTHRMGVFKPLALVAWRGILAVSLPKGLVSAGLTVSMKRMFNNQDNYNK